MIAMVEDSRDKHWNFVTVFGSVYKKEEVVNKLLFEKIVTQLVQHGPLPWAPIAEYKCVQN